MGIFDKIKQRKERYDPKEIVAPVDGEVIALSNVKDEVFAIGSMGMALRLYPPVRKYDAPWMGLLPLFFQPDMPME